MFGYKAFNSDMTCRDFQYEVGKEYSTSEEISLCERGFHFCENIIDCFCYYHQPDARFAKVEALGRVIRSDEDSKCVTDRIRIIEEIPMDEAVRMANTGTGNAAGCINSGNFNSGNINSGNRNSGEGNSGSYNTGDYNPGDWNSGDCNSGHGNSGHSNSGDSNSGDYNSGGHNSGDRNSGDRNSGGWNSGSWNSGNFNSKDYNSGSHNSGHGNSGSKNRGNLNTGDVNLGVRNSGGHNTGDNNSGSNNSGNRNSGHMNSGNANSGDYNSGRRNSGDRNLGDRNSGDWNLSSGNNGCFMTDEPTIMMFNKPTTWTVEKWRKSKACQIMFFCPADYRDTEWIPSEEMTDTEKKEHPEHETTGGYVKIVSHAADRQAWWDNLSVYDRRTVKRLPNFDADIFFKITGIRA